MNPSEPSGQRAQRIADFIARWSAGGMAYAMNEEQGAQQHFIELCALLGVAPPAGDDDYLFEKGTLLLGQRRGYADVFKRGCFAWENKAPGKPLDVWIGELQWRLQHGYPFKLNPVLDPLDQIECWDALISFSPSMATVSPNAAISKSLARHKEGRALQRIGDGVSDNEADGTVWTDVRELLVVNGKWVGEASWPIANAVVGNPPFLGDKKMRFELGDDYTDALRAVFAGRVPGGADLVSYWFEKARKQIESHGLGAAGFVATNSIRQGASREVLQAVLRTTRIFEAWGDMPWVNEGAAVRVSLVCFGHASQMVRLDGIEVQAVYGDLKAHAAGAGGALDLTQAKPLGENASASFFGFCLAGPFTVEPRVARDWLRLPANPNGRPNSDVLKPIWNGADVTRRPADRWAVDFGATMTQADAALYEQPFEYALRTVKPARVGNREKARAERWWLHGRARPDLRHWLAMVPRMIVTSETAKHRYFVWLPVSAAPEHKLVVIPRSDDATFGLLSSRAHVLWAVATGGRLGVGNDPVYSTGKCFEPFAFPAGLTPADTAHQRTESLPEGALIPADLPRAIRPHAEAIAHAAKRLNELRERWLNPPEWTRREPEVVPLGMDHSPYPDRILPRDGFEKKLAQRTLTKLYNERPAWLAQAHETLDAAVAAAYGWADYTPQMPDEEILRRLLDLNRERANAQAR